jgi:hypothetical protein
MKKNKIIGGLVLGVALAAPRLMAQGALPSSAALQARQVGWAVRCLETEPGCRDGIWFRVLPPAVQREALARARGDVERVAERNETVYVCVVAGALLLWFLLAALHIAGLVDDALLLFRSLRRRRVEPAPGAWVAKGPGDSVVDVVVERPATALLGRGGKEQ